MADYPYLASNKNLPVLFEKIRTAAKPARFTQEFLSNVGLTSSNDRALPGILRKLGFLSEDGVPTVFYDQLRDTSTAKCVLADRIRALYSDLFLINTNINQANEADIKGAISRVTGKDENNVSRIFTTFKALCANADFQQRANTPPVKESTEQPAKPDPKEIKENMQTIPETHVAPMQNEPSFHYNIQIHLPATTDISVYNAIFRSIKENLFK